MMPGGYMVMMGGECVCWCRPYEVLDLTRQFVCMVDAVARIVTLL